MTENEPMVSDAAPLGSRFRPWMVEFATQLAAERDAANRFAAIDVRWKPLAAHLTRMALAAHQVLASWDVLTTYRPKELGAMVPAAALATIETPERRYTANRDAESYLLAVVRQFWVKNEAGQ